MSKSGPPSDKRRRVEPEAAPVKPVVKKTAARKPDTRKRPAGKKVPKVQKATIKRVPGPEILTEKQLRFVDEYIVDLNGTQAAIRAGYSTRTARTIAAENLTKPALVAAIQAAMDARSERTQITADQVLKRWHQIAFADANDLIEYRRVCCRNCHGVDHHYQWVDEAEYQRVCTGLLAEADPEGPPPALPTDAGGYGFNAKADPHEDCPECNGEGHGVPFIHDTRKLKPTARALYAGVKLTKDGIEVKMQDQSKALENIARHLKMFVDKSEIEVTKRPADMTDEELEAAILAKQEALRQSADE
ncbi:MULTISPECIES: terminase small subunit [Cupriavidus]